jgi:Kinetochore complex Sim4 subunit Fta1
MNARKQTAREPPAYPLYGSTYTLYRLSPLYHGNTPLLRSLNGHARRLRDSLVGDTLRGVQVAAELSEVSNTSTGGALRTCTWDLLGDEAAWERAHRLQEDDEDEISALVQVEAQDARGIHVELRYNQATHCAVLLGDPLEKSVVPGFTALPLLLVRMPVPVRETFLEYLSTTFDTRISPMMLRPPFLGSVLEKILERSNTGSTPDTNLFVKGLQIQLSFPSVTPLLKNIDMTFSPEDMSQFISRGRILMQRRSTVSSTLDIPPGSTTAPAVTGPFIIALSAYLEHHVAMSLEHPAIVLSKVALGSFAFAREGKLKVLECSAISQEIWEAVLQEAQTLRLVSKQEILMEAAPTGMEGRKSRAASARANERLPTDPPPPYELHDPVSRDLSRG